MNRDGGPHLDADLIIRALVDPGDLTADQERHLRQCPRCAAQKRRLEREMAALGREARRLAPRPAHAVRLSGERAGKARLPWRWLAPTAALAAAAALLLVIWLPSRHQPPSGGGRHRAGLQAMADDALLSQIDALVEDAMPAEYAAVTGLRDDTPDDDLTQFIVPSVSVPVPLSFLPSPSGGKNRC